jgi:hypothetical protein
MTANFYLEITIRINRALSSVLKAQLNARAAILYCILFPQEKKGKQRCTVTANKVLTKVICNTTIYIARLTRSSACFSKTTV